MKDKKTIAIDVLIGPKTAKQGLFPHRMEPVYGFGSWDCLALIRVAVHREAVDHLTVFDLVVCHLGISVVTDWEHLFGGLVVQTS